MDLHGKWIMYFADVFKISFRLFVLFYDLSEIFGSTGDISIVDEGLQNLGWH